MTNASVAGLVVMSDYNFTMIGSENFWGEDVEIQILLCVLFGCIFMLAVSGNGLVIFTLVHHHSMRTITNVYLLNLAISDLMLGVLCMPFTLIGTILRHFVFGSVMCKLVPYFQACSVSVSVWTLVAIAVERYYAICHPLMSRSWQTVSHSYHIIIAIWIGSLLVMAPIAVLSELIPTGAGLRKCRETWPGSGQCERAYNLILDVILLVVPLLVLAATYIRVTMTLCRSDPMTMSALEHGRGQSASCSVPSVVYVSAKGNPLTRCPSAGFSGRDKNHHFITSAGDRHTSTVSIVNEAKDNSSSSPTSLVSTKYVIDGEKELSSSRTKSVRVQSSRSWHQSIGRSTLRRTNPGKDLMRKKRIVKMLLVVVMEFFVCWTPLYVINTIVLFDSRAVYDGLGTTGISFFQLLAYSSSCCNPITYCFMNDGFRKSFLGLFKRFNCSSCPRRPTP